MAETRRRLLWTDDDGPNRFEYERYRITQRGWTVSWAENVLTAARALAEEPFDALILDQMIAYEGPDRGPLFSWGGCLLLCWLRGSYPPSRAPLSDIAPSHDLKQMAPMAVNARIRVMVVSAFHDDEVLAEIRAASEMDRKLAISPKPMSEKDLLDFLSCIEEGPDRGS